jgi:hypothetical protein
MESRQPTPIDGGLNQQYQREALKRRGPGVDRHVKILIHLAAKGSLLDAYSQLRRIGLVAIGREFAADLSVARLALY